MEADLPLPLEFERVRFAFSALVQNCQLTNCFDDSSIIGSVEDNIVVLSLRIGEHRLLSFLHTGL
jgi:hypothetical protein